MTLKLLADKGLLVSPATCNLGCDPEFFFMRDGKVIGSEKIIKSRAGMQLGNDYAQCKVIMDGVQAELNPNPSHCRAHLGHAFKAAFAGLQAIAARENFTIHFGTRVRVNSAELDSLSPEAKQLGCAPSLNIHPETKVLADMPMAQKTLIRSAGGHIHMGFGTVRGVNGIPHPNPAKLVPILDIILGNTCVLLDRDPGAAQRRLYYGRAGEYRLPKHGLEYRTLSNFWIQWWPLASFVFATARFCVSVAMGKGSNMLTFDQHNVDWYEELILNVDLKKVQKAINTNNYDLAMENFEGICPWLEARTRAEGNTIYGEKWPLNKKTIPSLLKLAKDGIDKYIPKDILSHWAQLPEAHNGGWESWAYNTPEAKKIA